MWLHNYLEDVLEKCTNDGHKQSASVDITLHIIWASWWRCSLSWRRQVLRFRQMKTTNSLSSTLIFFDENFKRWYSWTYKTCGMIKYNDQARTLNTISYDFSLSLVIISFLFLLIQVHSWFLLFQFPGCWPGDIHPISQWLKCRWGGLWQITILQKGLYVSRITNLPKSIYLNASKNTLLWNIWRSFLPALD